MILRLFFLELALCFSLFAEADLILHRGRIVTVDNGFSIQPALAVEGENIAAVGSNEDVLKLRGNKTRVIDLQGKMVLPGLIDSHVHAAAASLTEFDHPIPQMENLEDVLKYISARAQVVKKGEWIIVSQVFITRLKEQRYPTLAELDRVAPNHPVMFQTGPDAMLNSLGLQENGISREGKTRSGTGFAELDPATGNLTGLIRNQGSLVKTRGATRQPTADEKVERLAELFRNYNASGITMVCDRNASLQQIGSYKTLRGKGMTVRVRASQSVPSTGPLAEILDGIKGISKDPLFREDDDWLRIIGIKTFLDGGMLTGSAYMREPWGISKIYGITDPQYRGVLFIPADRLQSMVRAAIENDLQFTAHSVGDGAVHALLDAYNAVAKDLSLSNSRACISHCNFMSQDAVEQAAKLGVVIDIQPAWLFQDTRTLAKQFSYDRLRYFQPLASLFKSGAIVGGGSDHMQKIPVERSINLYSPFLGMATTITRRARDYDRQLHTEEALTREQAIRMYTINNARVLRCEKKVGSLEKGKLADFVVIDRDLLKCPDHEVVSTSVLQTYVGGKLVYARN